MFTEKNIIFCDFSQIALQFPKNQHSIILVKFDIVTYLIAITFTLSSNQLRSRFPHIIFSHIRPQFYRFNQNSWEQNQLSNKATCKDNKSYKFDMEKKIYIPSSSTKCNNQIKKNSYKNWKENLATIRLELRTPSDLSSLTITPPKKIKNVISNSDHTNLFQFQSHLFHIRNINGML